MTTSVFQLLNKPLHLGFRHVKVIGRGDAVELRVDREGRGRSSVGHVLEVTEAGIRVRWDRYPESAGFYLYQPRELELARRYEEIDA